MSQNIQNNSTEFDVRAWCFRILKNWYWFVLSCAICGAIGVYYYMSHTQNFSVDANLMLRNNENGTSLPQLEMMELMGMGGNKKVDDEVAILTSRDLLTQVIKELDLQSEYRCKKHLKWVGQYPARDLSIILPPMMTDTMTRTLITNVKVRKNDYVVRIHYGRFHTARYVVQDLSQPISSFVGELKFEIHTPMPVGSRYYIRTTPILPLVNQYQFTIKAAPIKKESSIIHIATTTDMPKRAIDFMRRQIELYNLDAVVDKNVIASNTATFIEERLHFISKELSDAEAGVEQYKESNHITDLSSQAKIYLSESTEYRKRIAEVETQLNLVQFVGDFVSDENKRNMLIPANLGIEDEGLTKLIDNYNDLLLQRMRVMRTATANNPVMEQLESQLTMMRENILVSISNAKQTLLISKANLNNQFGKTEIQRGNLPTQERQFIEVQRQKELKEAIYVFLYKKREENALTLASSVMPAKIIAQPQMNPTPVKPKLKIVALICLIMGMGIPVAIMYLYSILNNKLTDESKELESMLDLPFGGYLVKNHHGEHIAVREGENSVSAELFRTLRTNIRFMLPSDVKTPVILVTSSINGEGKSYVATNLALSLALLGKKVALVGLDVRKPMLAVYFNLKNKGCVTNYLSDETYTIQDTIVPSDFANLDILPAGVIPPNPSELLQRERLDELFAYLRKHYDYIVVDSAPVALVSDTFLLNRIADMTLYVCRAHYTNQEMVTYLNQIHKQKRLKNLVAVLNGVNANKVGYGYGYGYGAGKK